MLCTSEGAWSFISINGIYSCGGGGSVGSGGSVAEGAKNIDMLSEENSVGDEKEPCHPAPMHWPVQQAISMLSPAASGTNSLRRHKPCYRMRDPTLH